MKLIIHKLDGEIYAYFENEKHYDCIEHTSYRAGGRKGETKHRNKDLSNDCNLYNYDDGYWVIDVKKGVNRK